MCEIKKGDIVYLVKGGKVLLPNGFVYPIDSCKWLGGKIILGVQEVGQKPVRKKPKKPVLNQPFPLDIDLVDLGEYELKSTEIVISPPKTVKDIPTPPSYTLPFTVIGIFLLYTLKKLSGLDRKLKHGSCEIKHQQAITRIAKLEGKVLRKQVIDGGKKLKAKLDERKKDEQETKV